MLTQKPKAPRVWSKHLKPKAAPDLLLGLPNNRLGVTDRAEQKVKWP